MLAVFMFCALLKSHLNKTIRYEDWIMSLMTVEQVAEFLGVKTLRVERLERESLLPCAKKDVNGSPLFDQNSVEKYKLLAERLGGL